MIYIMCINCFISIKNQINNIFELQEKATKSPFRQKAQCPASGYCRFRGNLNQTIVKSGSTAHVGQLLAG